MLPWSSCRICSVVTAFIQGQCSERHAQKQRDGGAVTVTSNRVRQHAPNAYLQTLSPTQTGKTKPFPAKQSQVTKWHTWTTNILSLKPIHTVQHSKKLASFGNFTYYGGIPLAQHCRTACPVRRVYAAVTGVVGRGSAVAASAGRGTGRPASLPRLRGWGRRFARLP